MRRTVVFALGLAALPAAGEAKVVSRAIPYQDGETSLEGHLAWDDAVKGKRPGVLVVHEWWGLNDYARKRAEMLAELGYAAFALDMYGKRVTTHPKEAGEWAGQIRQNVEGWRRRARSGLAVLKAQEVVDPSRLAAIGYCFGGSTVLQLAYMGEDLKGVVSFHGALPAYQPGGSGPIRARILVCHGADDSFISAEQIEAFRKALDAARADWQMVHYGGARHSFTNPGADKVGLDDLRYDEKADRRSWTHMRAFLDEVFAKGG